MFIFWPSVPCKEQQSRNNQTASQRIAFSSQRVLTNVRALTLCTFRWASILTRHDTTRWTLNSQHIEPNWAFLLYIYFSCAPADCKWRYCPLYNIATQNLCAASNALALLFILWETLRCQAFASAHFRCAGIAHHAPFSWAITYKQRAALAFSFTFEELLLQLSYDHALQCFMHKSWTQALTRFADAAVQQNKALTLWAWDLDVLQHAILIAQNGSTCEVCSMSTSAVHLRLDWISV